ncbi:MAG TPA: hypothetical protein VGX46_17240 [Vicinamibacterales bacterium]|nr:hypothetical protein [Vicinamibacterales bacterium]
MNVSRQLLGGLRHNIPEKRTHAKPSTIVLVGMSMGGYFAPRAAAFDSRIDGVVAFDVCYDFGAMAKPILSAAANPLAANNPDVIWGYHNSLWTLGTKGLDDTIKAVNAFTLAPIADRIRQDVPILAGADDHFVPQNQAGDFEKALINARTVTTRTFERRSGGSQHCQAGNLTLVYAAVFDWLLAKFGRS